MTQETAHLPSELQKEVSTVRHSMQIGIPKENQKTEKRLAFTPEAVDILEEAGYEIILEEGAGCGIRYSDADYAEAGATITADRSVVFGCDLIFKITPPTLEEIQWMKKRATILSMLQMPDINIEIIKAMAAKQIHAVGYELISPDGSCFPVRDAISEIEGAADRGAVVTGGNDNHGNRRILRAQIDQTGKAADARHREIKQDQVDVGVLLQLLGQFLE